MNTSKRNTDSYFPTIIFIVLTCFLLAFTNSEKKDKPISPNISYQLFVETYSNAQAVIPPSTDLPICASFSDYNHIILTQLFLSVYSTNLYNDLIFRTAQEKHLFIKPVLNRVVRRLIFTIPDSNDFKAIS